LIDIHSHILHNLDDGPKEMEQSLGLALMAVQEGISTIIATPHHRKGNFLNPAQKVIGAVSLFQEQLIQNRIPLTICHGQEIHAYPQMVDDYYANSLLTLNGSSYMLIEFPSSKLPERIEETFHELSLLHITPIIAHPERNREIAKQPDKLLSLVENGALSQVTSHSINGSFGSGIRSLTLELCRRNLVHFIASDVHDAVRRPFHLQQAYETLNTKLGGGYVRYYQQNAESLIGDRMIERWKPLAKPSRGILIDKISRIFGI
jgi:protein-tyrosine phosphatase